MEVMTMINDPQWKDCNDMIGRVLTYLDDEEVRRATKMAIKSEIWNFHNKYNGDDNEKKEIGTALIRNDMLQPKSVW